MPDIPGPRNYISRGGTRAQLQGAGGGGARREHARLSPGRCPLEAHGTCAAVFVLVLPSGRGGHCAYGTRTSLRELLSDRLSCGKRCWPRGLEEQLPNQGRFAWRLSADRNRGTHPRPTSLRGRRGLPGCPPVSHAG